MKKILSIIITLLLTLLCFAGCAKSDVHVSTDVVVSPDDYPTRVGMADYLFVAHVIEITDTFEIEGRLFTTYKAKVVKNLKGELIQDDYIQVIRHGGVYEDGRKYIVDGNDIEPEVDRGYTILAYAQTEEAGLETGSLYMVSMEPAEVDISAEKDTAGRIDEKLAKDETYLKWKKGYENEIPYERERAKSIYDVAYKE
jgi:hypothetical protein